MMIDRSRRLSLGLGGGLVLAGLAADSSRAWTVYSCDFGVYDIAKVSTGFTLAVR